MKIISFFCYLFLAFCIFTYAYNFNLSLKKADKKEDVTENIKYDEKLENYVVGVLACEMPALYNDEALKAQAVAIRTFALYIDDYQNSTEQCYITLDEMKKKWGSKFDLYYEKLKKDVDETNGIVLNKNNELFKTFYFSLSNGYTLDSLAVFSEGNIKGVESAWDKRAKDYQVTKTFKKSELKKILGDFSNIVIKSKDKTGHVLNICVDDRCISGIKFRKMLELRSTDFDINVTGDNYFITTRGYGHGVGMSQNGANYLANQGYDYKYILKYYYQDVDFVSII